MSPQPRKSDALHELEGTRPEYAPELSVAGGLPKCPAHLGEIGRKTFRQLSKMLEERRTVTVGDREIIGLYAELKERYLRAIDHIRAEGEITQYTVLDSNGQPHEVFKPNLWLKVTQDAEAKMRGILADLGLNPVARPKVRPTQSKTGVQFL